MSAVFLITGCRSGIGLATAEAAGRAGHVVYAGLRDRATAERLVSRTRSMPVFPLQLDITKESERRAALEKIHEEQGRLDVLVNNAGVALGGFLELIDEDELRRVFEVNVFGTWALTCACLPALRAHGGIVINVSSMSGRMAFPGLGVYAASKFALEGLSEAWRHELGLTGVRLAMVEPGAYKTDIWFRNRRLGRRARDAHPAYGDHFSVLEKAFGRVVDRLARDPREVAEKIMALAADPHPPLRNPLGGESGLRELLLRVLPFSVLEKAFKLGFKWAKR
jgi:NAD(P)-dependent dehydrogenase (short-subunit alcohol dehydrogenase family)